LLLSISLFIGCRKKESGQQEQAKAHTEEGPKSAQVDAPVQEIRSPSSVLPPVHLRVLYVFGSDLAATQSFASLLEASGCSVALIGLEELAGTPLAPYDLIIVGNDTGQLSRWGDARSVAAIESSGKPIVGLGEGGYALFGRLGLSTGHGNGWHGDVNAIYVVDPSSSLFNTPHPIVTPQDHLLQLYARTKHVGIYLASVPESVVTLGREVSDHSHYPLTLEQNRYLLWGFTGSAADMTEVGKDLLVNAAIWTANRNQATGVSAVGPGAGVEAHTNLPLGTVEVPNGFIAVVANSSNKRITLKSASGTVQLPVGEYRIDSWTMDRRDKEGNLWSLRGENFGNKGVFQVVEGQTTKLPVGEPIVSSLTAYKADSTYRLRHVLKGQMGENIQITKNGGRPEAPKLKISSSDGAYQETLIFAYG
jgi:hypothetical protein